MAEYPAEISVLLSVVNVLQVCMYLTIIHWDQECTLSYVYYRGLCVYVIDLYGK